MWPCCGLIFSYTYVFGRDVLEKVYNMPIFKNAIGVLKERRKGNGGGR